MGANREKSLLSAHWLGLGLVALAWLACYDASDFSPAALYGSLLTLALAGEFLALRTGAVKVTPSFLAVGLGMALMGPVPAATIGVIAALVPSAVHRIPRPLLLNNLLTYATFPILGGAIIEAVAEPVAGSAASFDVALLVVAVYLATNFVNFSMIVGFLCLRDGRSFAADVRSLYMPVLPWEFATGAVTAATVLAYQQLGVAAVGVLAVMLFTYQLLLKAVVQSERQRGELKAQLSELVELHDGILLVMMETLSLRDPATARHAAAVARFSRATAEAAGMSEADQSTAHLAGLLHDIGKFSFPDKILGGGKLAHDDWALIKRHPDIGADIVGRVKGFDQIAMIIRDHHERIDGTGYPAGKQAGEIEPLAKILAVADTFDAMTARDSYRSASSREEAFDELRAVAGVQLDAQLVETFIHVVESGLAFGHADNADFEAELLRGRGARALLTPDALAVQ